jgi:hypothetical protein
VQSLRRRVWATRFFENSVPDAFDAHFFNGLLMNSRQKTMPETHGKLLQLRRNCVIKK